MAEIYQAALPRLSNASKTTWGLVVVYHFLVPAILTGAIAFDWAAARSSREDLLTLEVLSGVGAPFVLLYVTTGWGILRWKNWSRTLSLVLNWINVIAAVANVARLGIEGVISVLLSCLVLWWLSMPAVKLGFRAGSEAR